MLKKNGNSRYPSHISYFNGIALNFSPFDCCLSHVAFIVLRGVYSAPVLWLLLWRHPEIFVKDLFCIYWDDHVILFLSSYTWFITFIDIHMLNHSCIFRMKLSWSWRVIFLIDVCIHFTKVFLLKIFASVFIGGIYLAYGFLCCFFTWFCYYNSKV